MDLDGESDEFWENSSVVSENYLEEMDYYGFFHTFTILRRTNLKLLPIPRRFYSWKRPSSPESTASSSEKVILKVKFLTLLITTYRIMMMMKNTSIIIQIADTSTG